MLVKVPKRNLQRSSATGFTLLELLVAMAIFAFLATASYGILDMALNTRDHTERAAKSLQNLQMGMTILQRDLMQLVNTSIVDEFGDEQPALLTPKDRRSLVEFTHSGWRNSANQARSNLQRVAYALDDNTLYRYHWPRLHRASQQQPIKAVLLKDIEEVELDYLDQENSRWHAEWPPITLTGNPGLPAALRLTITFLDGDQVVRLFGVNQ